MVNNNYEVKIGGVIKNLRDIYSFEQLYSLGRTYYNIGQPSIVSDKYSEFTFSTSKENIGERYESGWRYSEDGKRKLNLKIDRQLHPGSDPVLSVGESKLHVEISFRKKTFLGWATYSSETTITGQLSPVDTGWTINYDRHQSAWTSHDYWDYLGVVLFTQNNRRYASFPYINGKLTIDFRGFSKKEVYDVHMNGAYCGIPNQCVIYPSVN